MWVRIIDEEEAKALIDVCRKAGMKDTVARLELMLADSRNEHCQTLRDMARELYAHGSDNDIEVDDDAAFSHAEEHSFVQAWVYVSHVEAGVEPAAA